jgi:hypothetical protein
MIWTPTLTGEAPTVAGYSQFTTEPGGAMILIGSIVP